MEKFFKTRWLSLSLGFLLVCGSAWAAEPILIRHASANPEGSFHAIYAHKFKELLEGSAPGQIKVEVTLGGKLGSEEDNVTDTSAGTLTMTTVAVNNLTPVVRDVGVLSLPYLFPKAETAQKLLNGSFAQKLNERLKAKANLRALSWLIGGYRVLTNSQHPVKTLADIQGLKIRVPENAIMIATYRAWGLEPVPLAWLKTYEALKSGEVNGQDNPYIVNASSKFYEVQKYITPIRYLLWTGPHLVHAETFEKWPPTVKTAVEKAAQSAAAFTWEWVQEQDQKALQTLLQNGMTLTEPTDETEWMAKARSIWPHFYEKIGGQAIVDEALQQIQASEAPSGSNL